VSLQFRGGCTVVTSLYLRIPLFSQGMGEHWILLVSKVQIDKKSKTKDHRQKDQRTNTVNFDTNAQAVSRNW
jgi:hypothetical protein